MIINYLKVVSRLFLFTFLFSAVIAACSPAAPPATTEKPSSTSEPTSLPAVNINLEIDLPEGDPDVGLNRAVKFRCFACHVQESNGIPFDAVGNLPVIMERGEVRIADPAYQGNATTNHEYLLESILNTEVYIVPGDWENAMPTYFEDIMTEQDLADVINWMSTIK